MPRRTAPPPSNRALAPLAEAFRKAPRRLQRRRERTPLEAAAAAIELKPADQLRLFTLNVAHGRRQESHQALLSSELLQRNLADVAATLRALAPDVVALQEADGPSAWSGNFDHVEMLAELAELAAHYRGNHNPFGRGRFFNLASGTALLSRLPLSEASSERFAKSWRDTKGFVAATIAVPHWGDLGIDVVSVHLDFLTPNVRRRQISMMIDKLKGRDRPLVILGDLNCCWRRDPKSLDLLTGELGLRAHQPEEKRPTYPSHRPRHRLDWILISEHLDFGGYHTVAAPLSDHLGLVADIKLK